MTIVLSFGVTSIKFDGISCSKQRWKIWKVKIVLKKWTLFPVFIVLNIPRITPILTSLSVSESVKTISISKLLHPGFLAANFHRIVPSADQ